jgi:hypothetical protein
MHALAVVVGGQELLKPPLPPLLLYMAGMHKQGYIHMGVITCH